MGNNFGIYNDENNSDNIIITNNEHEIIINYMNHNLDHVKESDKYSIVCSTIDIRDNMWKLINGKLLQEGKSIYAIYILHDVVIKCENGKPVYGNLFGAKPINDTTEFHKLIKRRKIEITVVEIEH